ncbi:potassium transporter [bacterium]|nr:potassium transporter [bacterium]
MDGVLFQALVYLTAGVVAAPIAKRLGLGSVLGYLAAGVIIGPVLQIVGEETSGVQTFAEYGVVMMLFLIGLELQPQKLWDMRDRLIGLGGLQVALTSAAFFAAGLTLGLDWKPSLAVGMILSLSSTAIVLQTLNEKGWMKTDGGRSSFSVLLFQDIAVIPILAVLPLLGSLPDNGSDHAPSAGGHGGASALASLPEWAQGLAIVAAIGLVILGGRYLMRPAFRFIARSGLSEIFTAAALLLVVAIAWLMTLVGLSPALGAFIGGVVLADSEFRHELESDIEPFKALLLGLFFITVGAGINFGLLMASPGPVFALALGLMVVKLLILALLARLFRMSTRDGLIIALGLAQAGEFAFVLISFASAAHVLDAELAGSAALIVAISMLLTPLLFLLLDKLTLPRLELKSPARDDDEIDQSHPVIIAGVGRFGQIVNRLLVSRGCEAVVLDHDQDAVEAMARFEQQVFFGDASRPALLRAAGLATAEVFVCAIDDKARAVEIVEFVRRERSDIRIVARAFDRLHYYELKRAGADVIVREMFEGSLKAGVATLLSIGVPEEEALKAAAIFREHDNASVDHLYTMWDADVAVTDNPTYIEQARQRRDMLIEAMRNDRKSAAQNEPT